MEQDRREAPRVPVDKDIDASVNGVRVRVLELSVSGARIEHTERLPLKGAVLSMSWNLRTIELPLRIARSEIAGRSGERLLYSSGIFFVHTDAGTDAFILSIIGESATPAAAFGVPADAPQPAVAPSFVLEPVSSPSPAPLPFIAGAPLPPPEPGAPVAFLDHDRKVQPEAVTVKKIERRHEEAAVAVAAEPPRAAAVSSVEQATAADVPARSPEPQAESSFEDSWVRQVNFLRDDPEDQLPYAQFRLTAQGWEKSYVATPDQPEDGFTVERGTKDFIEMQRTFEWADEETRRMLRAALKAKMGQA